jgi:putative nucleotidyltransferase with HDIG domain
MARDAPGSWEHARAMANLAEAAASSIGADALLTRVGAYYHDLGKTCQCKYFIENLDPGETSPHEGLDPDVSADAIMAHVVEGVRILRGGRTPEPVVEFAYTHHGTSVIEYFWHKCVRLGNPKKLGEDAFRYPGMKPRTKETAILMLVDSIEAGARTVDPPSREGFEKLVERVMFSKMKQGQLDDAGLTMEEMRVLANRLVDTLCSVYHSRIRYPWQDEEQKRQEQAIARDVAAPLNGDASEDRISDERARVSTPPGIDTRDDGIAGSKRPS